jgi:hypothetical protein
MGLSPEKRAFLVKHYGEKRTRKIEERLTRLGTDLEEAGVAFKQLAQEAPASPYGGAVSWQELCTYEDDAAVWEQFDALLDNIRQSGKPPGEQARLLSAAAAGLTERLGKLKTAPAGVKASGGPLAPYVADLHRLLGPRPRPSPAGVKEIERLGDPVARYLAQLVAGNVERGG